jgi:K+-sensing histidine kinase KdpD
LAQFYRKNLVRPAFVPLLDQWQADLAAGQTPQNLFENPDYINAQFADYQQAVDQAEALSAQSQQASATSDEYVITTILLAIALFFAGVTSSFRYQPARILLVLLAVATVAVAAVRLADLPIA